jgi:hypothetical protein
MIPNNRSDVQRATGSRYTKKPPEKIRGLRSCLGWDACHRSTVGYWKSTSAAMASVVERFFTVIV